MTIGSYAALLQNVFHAAVITKLCYSSSTRQDFTSAGDRQHLVLYLMQHLSSAFCQLLLNYDDNDDK